MLMKISKCLGRLKENIFPMLGGFKGKEENGKYGRCRKILDHWSG